MTDLPKAADLAEQAHRGRLHVLGVRIREDGVPIACVVVAAPKPDGQWLIEVEGVEESAVLLSPESIVEFAEAILARASEGRDG